MKKKKIPKLTADQRHFRKEVENGMEMWTSEDGTLISIVIDIHGDWAKRLQENYPHIFEKEAFDSNQARTRFLRREWGSPEWFDNPAQGSQRKGKLWNVYEQPPGFVVVEYVLKIPR